MSVNLGRRAGRVLVLTAALMMVAGPGIAPPVAADTNQCAPTGADNAIALPRKLASARRPHEDKYTTPTVEPLSAVNIGALGLITPGTLTVGTLSQAPPTSCCGPSRQSWV